MIKTQADIIQQRLYNQHLSRHIHAKPQDIVALFGCVQAQEYGLAKWGLGRRISATKYADIDAALAEGTILRTHIMRPTWHFVTPEDIGWIMKLTAPRVKVATSYYLKDQGLTAKLLARCNTAIAKALEGDSQLTRAELAEVLKQNKITTTPLQMGFIMGNAELDCVVCSGAIKGKLHTYALFDERVPKTKPLQHDEALAKLALRYFTAHGPATVHDFAWWAGLTVTDARAAILENELEHDDVDGVTYWYAADMHAARNKPGAVFLLPVYDEYAIAYKDRTMLFETKHKKSGSKSDVVFNNIMVINGKIEGFWKRTINKKVLIEVQSLVKLTAKQKEGIEAEAARYGKFMDNEVTLVIK